MGFKIRIKIVDMRNNVIDDLENIDELVEYLDDYLENNTVKEVMVVVR
jgi:hypothetical protein